MAIKHVSASGATGIAGALHLSLVPVVWPINEHVAIFFLISGILQLLWIFLTLRKIKPAYYVGMGGSVFLILLWIFTRFPNPITDEAVSVNEIGIATKIFEGIFVGLNIWLIRTKDKKKV